MSRRDTENPVRTCAVEVLRLVDEFPGDERKLQEGLAEPVRRLIEMPDLLMVGVPREGNHVAFSRYLYFDPGLMIQVGHLPKGTTIPVHDHGIWSATTVYRGVLRHTAYSRVDDDSVPGHAELRVIEECELHPGDIAVRVPPDDIHSLTALVDDTYVLGIDGGQYSPTRKYYQPDQHSYLMRGEKALRTGR